MSNKDFRSATEFRVNDILHHIVNTETLWEVREAVRGLHQLLLHQCDKNKILLEGINKVSDRCCEPCCIYANEALNNIDKLTELKGD